MTVLLEDMGKELAALNQKIGVFDDELTTLAKSDPPYDGSRQFPVSAQ